MSTLLRPCWIIRKSGADFNGDTTFPFVFLEEESAEVYAKWCREEDERQAVAMAEMDPELAGMYRGWIHEYIVEPSTLSTPYEDRTS